MILDDHDDDPVDDEEVVVEDGDLDEDGEMGEWLGGLRAAGLPIRADATDRPTRPTTPAIARDPTDGGGRCGTRAGR